MSKKKVTGVGGVFFKCKDPDAVKEWYKTHLGFPTDQYGAMFTFLNIDKPTQQGHLQWSPFKQDTDYFQPSEKEFMINYRVENLEELVEELKAQGVTILDEIAVYDYGKFVHILDLENNKIELWEPVDQVFEEYLEEKEKDQ